MFERTTYIQRRDRLRKHFDTGILLFLGNTLCPMNFPANSYPFRQDSSFLYYFGHSIPDMTGIIDIDGGEDILFGKESTLEDAIWMGAQPSLQERGEAVGVHNVQPIEALPRYLARARTQRRTIHYLPQYRTDRLLQLAQWLHIKIEQVNARASESLIHAVVEQRSHKSEEEVREIERALEISRTMHITAMQKGRPGITEKELAGVLEGIALAEAQGLSFPLILTARGEILHNHPRNHAIQPQELILHDSGVNSPGYYASDITRTFPASGLFSPRQREIYELVLQAQETAIKAIRPGITYREVHLLAARVLTEGLIAIGLMKGDPEEAVTAGAHALFFMTGLGHMLGLDVHDMEALGEEYVGYNHTVKRSTQFGLNYLRLARKLEPGFVVTVEPGIYFNPLLIDQWEQEKRHEAFIRYERLAAYRNFGGIRIEDDVLVTPEGYRILGPPIPKKAEEVEAICMSGGDPSLSAE